MSTQIKPPNSTDATQHEPLAVRARTRRAELAAILATLPVDEKTTRGDIELALASVDALLTGDTAKLSDSTASDINKWLEGSKHLGEKPTMLTQHTGPVAIVADPPTPHQA